MLDKKLAIYRYKPRLHDGPMKHMCSMRDMDVERTISELPKLGLIVMLESEPVAAAFLRQVEGGFAMLDGLISNPTMPGYVRNEAIDMVVERIIGVAKCIGMPKLVAYSTDAGTLVRSERHGFKLTPSSVICLDLREHTK